eukprot:PITA_28291
MYLTRCVEAQPVKDYTGAETTMFLFEYVLTRFGFPKILMSDHGTHFFNEMISALTEEFQVYHQNSMPYHLQANGMVKEFNKILENTLMKEKNEHTTTMVAEACRTVLELHIPEEAPMEAKILKLAAGVRDAWTKMAKVKFEPNLKITKLKLREQPSTPPEVREQREAAVKNAVAVADSAVEKCTALFEQ